MPRRAEVRQTGAAAVLTRLGAGQGGIEYEIHTVQKRLFPPHLRRVRTALKPRQLRSGTQFAHFMGRRESGMSLLGWALVFLVVAILAAIFGFGGIAAASAGIAKILFFVFLIVFAVILIMALARRV